jgi:PilZ domain
MGEQISLLAMAADPETRRQHPRRAVKNVEMFCYRASPSATPQMRRNIGSEILDISRGGARVRVSEAVGRGETVTLELRDRASGESFRARGEVRWSTAAGLGHLLGVQFSEHYTPVGDREVFTASASPAPKSSKAEGLPDITLTPAEKRQAERFSLKDYNITLYRQGTLGSQGLKRNLGRSIHDISLTGAQLEVSEGLEPGVRWCRPDPAVAGSSYRAGLQFLNLGDAQRKKIDFMRKWFTKPKKK